MILFYNRFGQQYQCFFVEAPNSYRAGRYFYLKYPRKRYFACIENIICLEDITYNTKESILKITTEY